MIQKGAILPLNRIAFLLGIIEQLRHDKLISDHQCENMRKYIQQKKKN